MNLPTRVELVEVGLRDGLQNQARTLTTDAKLELLEGLLDAGLRRIQVASFVHPKRVPQMADAEALCARLPDRPGVVYSGLALNRRGVERAAAAGLTHVDASLSASDAHSRANAGMGLDEARAHLADTIAAARALGLGVRGGVQCAFGLPGEAVPVARVAELARHLADQGLEELALADSTGLADPAAIERVVLAVRKAVGALPLVLHLHDTRGLGLANVLAALQLGVTRFDTAFGGLGGCPFIPGATGNIATEDTAHLLAALGVATGVDVERVAAVTARAEALLEAPMPSKLYALWRREQGAAAEDTAAAEGGPARAADRR